MHGYALLPPAALTSYDEYRRFQGGSVAGVLGRLDRHDLLAQLTASGLSGRGGGAFPTGRKWRSLASRPGPGKCVVANAAEGEPGSFKDRWLMRRNPYVVLEGLLLAAAFLETRRVYLATKAAYEPEIARLEAALEELVDAGVPGAEDVEIFEGPDEYLFGEEKAMLQAIEGTGPFPREPHYPPYEWGLDATTARPNPTLVQNVETLARAATVALHGGGGFAAIGGGETRGPILVTLSGAVARPGVYEVAAGRAFDEVLATEGGGPAGADRWVGALPGVAHPVLPEPAFGTPLDHSAMAEAGSGLGSGGFILLEEGVSLPRVAEAVARFLAVESCAQCTACKMGLEAAYRGLKAVRPAAGAGADARREIEEAARGAPNANRCNLPVQGAEILPALLERYPGEFAAPPPAGRPFLLPKFLDFDPETPAFVVDRRHLRKRMDWSYRPAPSPRGPGPAQEKGADSGGVETPAHDD